MGRVAVKYPPPRGTAGNMAYKITLLGVEFGTSWLVGTNAYKEHIV